MKIRDFDPDLFILLLVMVALFVLAFVGCQTFPCTYDGKIISRDDVDRIRATREQMRARGLDGGPEPDIQCAP